MLGTRLGPWVLDRELGRGGMGTVYLAHRGAPADGAPDRAAVKVLAAELAVEPGFLARFQREIEALMQLAHPNIVAFYESGQEGGRYYYAMEYVPGRSLESLLLERRKLPWTEVLDLALQIAPALKHAHDRGVIHRDLKPSNLIRTPPEPGEPESPGVVKLADFGIASLFAGRHLTVTGGVIGTPEYLSPEQAAGKPVTRRSDLYSLGVLLYTLLTGRTPFEGEPLDLLHKHRFAQFDRPSRVVPELPPDLDQIVCDLLEKEPARRPADGSVLHRRLEGLRRKLQRQADGRPARATGVMPLKEEGPATLMSRLMRGELHRQKYGGPVRQFFHRPAVLVTGFALTVGLLVWLLWPASEKALYERGAALMARDSLDEWGKAMDYFDKLQEKYPENPYRPQVAEFQRRYEERSQEEWAGFVARRARPMSEGQWFYQKGLRLRQRGDEAGARRVWKALIAGFGEVSAEEPWVRKAEEALAAKGEFIAPNPWRPLRTGLERARELRAAGKRAEAADILRGLKELYRGDAAAQKILEKEK
jgi:serine/threonine-protein kinase